MLKNVLCDRDGTIIYDKHYLCDPEEVELLPGAARGLWRLAAAGIALFVVTNQSGMGRGMYTLEQYKACENRLDALLAEAGAPLRGTAYCPHAPGDEECACRKPDTGMWESLSALYQLKARECAMVGDKMSDVRFGKNAGLARTVLVLTGKGEKSAADVGLFPYHPELGQAGFYCPDGDGDLPDCVAKDLGAASAYLRMEVKKGLI